MNQAVKIYQGRVITAQDYAQQQEANAELKAATAVAEDIIAEAEARAAEIISAAEANVQQIADDQLERFIDVQAVEKAADSLRDMLEATGTIRSDFDAFTPWLTGFVEASVLRITGALPPETLWAGLIEQGLSDIRDRWNLVLLCHPTLVQHLKNVVSATPALQEVIRDVHPDRTLGLQDCLIQSGQGITDISLSTQLAALIKALEKFPAAASPDGESAERVAMTDLPTRPSAPKPHMPASKPVPAPAQADLDADPTPAATIAADMELAGFDIDTELQAASDPVAEPDIDLSREADADPVIEPPVSSGRALLPDLAPNPAIENLPADAVPSTAAQLIAKLRSKTVSEHVEAG